ncbi:sensor histidine kinase [Bacillus tuaregi]|uniref:sensor histidine kinase n=1 Tax=Bacillus tuaregi TaxID=1816695 RepID=UPI0008F83005|nr:sensor histidine kinase [Bacillus tuaregi]
MSFHHYLKDKRFFFLFYLVLMAFISIMTVVSVEEPYAFANVLYINLSGFLLVLLYITIGYFYHRTFYRELMEWTESEQDGVLVSILQPSSQEQRLFLRFLEKRQKDHFHKLQQLYDEKLDHQEFILSWIHEVKLPIAAGRLLIENSEGRSAEWLADKLEDELNKIDQYVEQALYYSRVDSFSKDYFITEVHLNQIVNSSVKKYAKLFINKGIQFEMDLADQYVQSDSKWLGFVIDQILANSLKYTNEGGKITIQLEEDSLEKRVYILDNGIGIKAEDIHRVFEKGFTGTIGRSHAKSTGIGLYLAKQLANKLGHDITIESEENSYTKVAIHFPKIRNYYHLS